MVIRAEAIYLHSIAHISMIASSPFDVYTEIEIVELRSGEMSSSSKGLISSVPSLQYPQRYCIELIVEGLFKEREISFQRKSSLIVEGYGMWLYPFVSSILSGKFSVSKQVFSIIIELPDQFRLLYSQYIMKQGTKVADLRHSFGQGYSQYLFSWKALPQKEDGFIPIDFIIPVKNGGTWLMSFAYFPIFYWSLAVVALVFLPKELPVLIGYISAAWIYLLQRWNNSNLPQGRTILTLCYLIYGALIAIWGISWFLFEGWALLGLIPLSFIAISSLHSINHFNHHGVLPKHAEMLFARIIDNNKARHQNNDGDLCFSSVIQPEEERKASITNKMVLRL